MAPALSRPQVESLEPRLLLANDLVVTADAPTVTPAFDTIGINLVYQGDDDQDGSMSLQYRPVGGTWQEGHYGLRVQPSYARGTINKREFATRLFNLPAGTQYEVRVTFADPDGVTGTAVRTFTVATRSEPVLLNTGGDTWHVDPTRPTNGNGSAGSPFNNLASAESAAGAGDTVLLYSGEYVLNSSLTWDQNGTASQPIIVKAAPGATPIIRGPKVALETPGGTTWRAEGAYAGVYSAPLTVTPEQVYHLGNYLGWTNSLANLVQGRTLNPQNGSTYDIGTYGGWWYDSAGQRLYVNIPQTWNDWSGPTIDPTAAGVGITRPGTRGFIPQGRYLVFSGLTFRYFAQAMFLYSSNVSGYGEGLVLLNDRFEYIVDGFYAEQQGSSSSTSTLRNALIDGCTFITSPTYGYRDWTLGHDVYGTQGVVLASLVGSTGVIRNSTFDSVENGIFIGQWSPNVGLSEANQGWVIQNNLFTKIGDDSIELEGSIYNHAIIGNFLTFGHTAFSLAPAGSGPTWIIRNRIHYSDWLDPNGNVMTNGAYPPPYEIFKFNSGYNTAGQYSMAVIYHNSIHSETSFTGIHAMLARWGTIEGMWFISRNNSYSLGQGSGGAILIEKPSGADSLSIFNADYDNVYVPPGNQYGRIWWQATDTWVTYPTFASLQAAGVETHGVNFLPPFADVAGGDFSVPVGTWLHDGGVYIPGINEGYQGNAPDIGVYEAPGTVPTRYALNVVSGTGDGSYAAGTVVPIAATIAAGATFDRWLDPAGIVANPLAAVTTLTMPAAAAVVTATFIATVYPVGAGQTYATIQAAVNAAAAYPAADAIVRVMDSGLYNEQVTLAAGIGDLGKKLTIEAAPGQTPTIYALWTMADYDVTLRGFSVNGNLRPYGSDPTAKGNMLYLRGNGNQTIENCIIRGRGTDGSAKTTALYGNAGTTITFRGNTFETDTFGIFPYSGQSGALIEGNTFKGDTGVSWPRSETAAPVIIRYNLFNAARVGIYRYSSVAGTNITIANNTFYRCGGATSYYDGAIMVREQAGGSYGPVIRDNLIVGKGAASPTQYDGLSSYTTAVTTIDADYNGFWNMRVSGGEQQVAYFTSAWKTIAQLNAISGASNNVVGASDPFVNAAAGDFRLVATSWAATAASNGDYIGAFAPDRLPGDADLNGLVDQADYLAWFRNYGRTDAAWATGDFDGNQLVDQSDYLTWFRNYGTVKTASPATAQPGVGSQGSQSGPDGSLDALTIVATAPTQQQSQVQSQAPRSDQPAFALPPLHVDLIWAWPEAGLERRLAAGSLQDGEHGDPNAPGGLDGVSRQLRRGVLPGIAELDGELRQQLEII